MARSMLKGKNMPHKSWGEATSTAVHIINRNLHESLKLADSWWAFLESDFEILCKIVNDCSIAFDLHDIVYTIWGKVQAHLTIKEPPFHFILCTYQTF
jgi:hypothetical protein